MRRTAPIALGLLLAVATLPVAALADDHGYRHGGGHHHDGRYQRSQRDDNLYERHRYDGHIETRRDFGIRDRGRHAPARYQRHERYEHRDRYGYVDRHDRYVHRTVRRPHFYPVGHRFAVLPRTTVRLVLGNGIFYYADGVYLAPRLGAYWVVGAPVGIRVPFLPAGYVSFFIGGHRYFYVNATYYLWDDLHADYVVVDEPPGAAEALARAGEPFGAPFDNPPEGRAADLDVCHDWAVAETGRDAWAAPKGSQAHDDYLNALESCLRGRGYAVR
jgi:hypothetical protein